MIHPQLTLALGTPPLSSFDTFYVCDANAQALSAVQAFCQDELGERQLLLCGDAGVGKTHLLSAACQTASNAGFQVAYLTGDLASRVGALDSLERMDLVCLDDVHLLAQSAEESLFHMINRCREANTRLLLASQPVLDQLPVNLPDLRTRLSWGPVYQLQAVPDAHLSELFKRLMSQRSLDVSDDVVDYVLRRYPRNVSALKTLADKLDQASMSTKRRITIPLVKHFDEMTV